MTEWAEQLAEIYSVFSNAKRILIFWVLNGREMSVNDIAEHLNSSVQNTSQHLRLMKSKRILSTRRDGQMIYYSISDNDVAEYCHRLHQEYLRRDLQIFT